MKKLLAALSMTLLAVSAQAGPGDVGSVGSTQDWKQQNVRPLIDAACQIELQANKVIKSSVTPLSCSISTTTAYAGESFDLADSLSRTSIRVFVYRLKNQEGNLSLDSVIQIRALEDKIDSLAYKFRARGVFTALSK